MNGIHDLGGMHGLGPVVREENEPVFHEDWERRVFAMLNLTVAAGQYNVDELRHSIERMPPARYLETSYYEHWLHAAEDLLELKGVLARTEVSGTALPKDLVGPAIESGMSARAEAPSPPRFRAGDRVIARNMHPTGHTRLPRYARGRRGVVQRHHGGFAFADTRAHGLGDRPQHLYNIRFEAAELWGTGTAGDAVYLDLWESYLEAGSRP